MDWKHGTQKRTDGVETYMQFMRTLPVKRTTRRSTGSANAKRGLKPINEVGKENATRFQHLQAGVGVLCIQMVYIIRIGEVCDAAL